MKQIRICLYGGPGSGKSTVAPLVFGKLKQLGCNVEQVNEYVKYWAYEKKKLESFDQVYIFAKQQRMEDRLLRAGVEIIVSDSPLYLQCVYSKKYDSLGWQELINIAHKFDKKYPSLNLLLKRHTGSYSQIGRYQTYEQAIEIDNDIVQFLNDYYVPYFEVENDAQEIVTLILHKLKEQNVVSL